LMKIIELEFKGYRREVNKSGLPHRSGIYCVYSCVYNKSEQTVSIKELIYIGESHDMNERIATHDRLDDWKQQLNRGEVLCYSYAAVTKPNRERAEAALIYKHKPPLNENYVRSFPFEDTMVRLSGKMARLCGEFVVRKREK